MLEYFFLFSLFFRAKISRLCLDFTLMERNIGGIREEKINVEMITFRGHEMLCYVLKILILEDDDRKMMKVSRKVEKTDVKCTILVSLFQFYRVLPVAGECSSM